MKKSIKNLMLSAIFKVKKTIKNLTLPAIFMAIGIVLPFFTSQIPAIGNMLLPMHIPVFLCGLICGWQYGAAVGVILPLFRSLLFGAPVMFPTASAMALELLICGLVAGLLYSRSRRQCVLSLYRSMLIAMIWGRVVWGAAQMIFLGIGGNALTWEEFAAFAAGVFLNAIPGIVLQLVFIPAVMIVLNKTGLVLFKNHRSTESARDNQKHKNKKAIVVCCITIISIIFCLQYYLPMILNNNKSSENKESDFNWSSLSQFDSHGQPSCERIWVIKTQSSWDSAPEKYFAYLDIDGNLIYNWKKLGVPMTKTYGWVPFDYSNGYAAMIEYDHKPEGTSGSGSLCIINKNGRGITRENILVYWEENFGYWEKSSDPFVPSNRIRPYFRGFNEDGYFYFYGKTASQERGVYYINTNGDTVRFKLLKDSSFYYENILREGIYYTEGYFYIKDGYSTSALFDSTGEMVLNIRETCNIDDYWVEVLNSSEIEVYFTGKDEKNYKCVIDFQGNFIEEPQRLE